MSKTPKFNWKLGDTAVIKCHCEGERTKLQVLGPAIFVEQWWVPVLHPEEEDPKWFKESHLYKEKGPEQYIPTSVREEMEEQDLPRTHPMFAIGQIQNRLSLQCGNADTAKIKLWHGPTPAEIDMLEQVGEDEFSVIIRYDLDGVDRIAWVWKEDRWEKFE
jgi:hypothetical protein